jgi:glycosyltransferase involved in cell wall biosynthesis
MAAQRRIAFYSSSLSKGGLELNSIRYAQYMQTAGYAVIFCCVENSPIHQACEKANISVILIRRNRRHVDWRAAFHLLRIHREHQIDWWWFRDPRDLDTMAWAKVFIGQSMRLLYHQGMQLGKPKKDWVHTWRFKKIDRWICLSQQLAQQVKDWTNFPDQHIHIIPLALQDDIQSQEYVSGAFRALVIGRWDPQKNQHTVVNAFQLLHHRYPHIEVTFIGESTAGEDVHYEKDIKKKVRHWDLQKSIHFEHFQYQLSEYFAQSHLFIMPSLNETFGMVTIEAMRAGLPIIGANTGGTAALIDENQCGLTFSPLDANELAAQWEKMIHDAALRSEKRKNARAAFEQKFSIQHQLHTWENLLG